MSRDWLSKDIEEACPTERADMNNQPTGAAVVYAMVISAAVVCGAIGAVVALAT